MLLLKSFIIFSMLKQFSAEVDFNPQQIHIALGDNEDEMVIGWATKHNPGGAVVEYGIDNFNLRANGTTKEFTSTEVLQLTQYFHKVVLKNLKPATKYIYHVGFDNGWSSLFYFKTLPTGTNWSPRIAMYGDFGNDNAQSLPRLQKEAQLGQYDLFIHAGDIAYDLHFDNGLVGNAFMNQIQPIASIVPYMVCPGNHEETDNFLEYRNRFNMPGNSDNMFYSFNAGPVHFISFSTEAYYYLNYGMKTVEYQYEFLERDLIEATKPENRKLRPWIITYGHRPMYCTDQTSDDCRSHYDTVRIGLRPGNLFALEPLFYKYGVDVQVYGHEHSYQRMWPMYNYTFYNDSMGDPYRNPKAPVHIIAGSAGCFEMKDVFDESFDWCAFRSTDYGYLVLHAHNTTHLEFKQISDDQDGAVIDHFYVIKDKHGSYQN